MVHGTNRVYKIQLEGANQTDFATIRVDEDIRPNIGDQIKLPTFTPNEIFKIMRTIPSGNPGGDNMIYIVEHESDRNLVACGDIISFQDQYLKKLKGGSGTWIFQSSV